MSTNRDRQLQQYYNKVKEFDALITDLNARASHLGIETSFTSLRLYKEQKDQIEEIMKYFDQVEVPPEQNNVEAILSLSLKEFHAFITTLKKQK
ncbi:hypothetical protein [Bacillus sp. FJAT-44742]|uniref:hypothetical protein n=1 Tax=Bacillus sp. FJAT-44742 TaxID=2014005 RepID=UPI000C250939|nr:hypothetical protein [Bacillus sp. FJAT-44742]